VVNPVHPGQVSPKFRDGKCRFSPESNAKKGDSDHRRLAGSAQFATPMDLPEDASAQTSAELCRFEAKTQLFRSMVKKDLKICLCRLAGINY
jgi:hypothetical protein